MRNTRINDYCLFFFFVSIYNSDETNNVNDKIKFSVIQKEIQSLKISSPHGDWRKSLANFQLRVHSHPQFRSNDSSTESLSTSQVVIVSIQVGVQMVSFQGKK